MTPLGPLDSPILILTDFPSEAERISGKPLSDYAGGLFWTSLAKTGLLKNSCLVYSFLDKAPPIKKGQPDLEEWVSKRKTCPAPAWRHIYGKWVSPEISEAIDGLKEFLSKINLSIIITLGEASLFGLLGQTGHAKWRGSRLSPASYPFQIIPTYHPRTLVKAPEQTLILQADLKRAKAIYEGTQLPRDYKFLIQPTFDQVWETLAGLLFRSVQEEKLILSGDLETRSSNIACLGIAWSATEAICIPFLKADDEDPFYWSEEEETKILHMIAQLFMSPNVHSIGQNYLYDCQYFWRQWGFLPSSVGDTMIASHSIYSNMRKGLDFLSSLYSQDHQFWKEEIRDWNPTMGEKQYWTYNCKDACITWEIWPQLLEQLEEG